MLGENKDASWAAGTALVDNLLAAHRRLCTDLCGKLTDPKKIKEFTREIKELSKYIYEFAQQFDYLVTINDDEG